MSAITYDIQYEKTIETIKLKMCVLLHYLLNWKMFYSANNLIEIRVDIINNYIN